MYYSFIGGTGCWSAFWGNALDISVWSSWGDALFGRMDSVYMASRAKTRDSLPAYYLLSTCEL